MVILGIGIAMTAYRGLPAVRIAGIAVFLALLVLGTLVPNSQNRALSYVKDWHQYQDRIVPRLRGCDSDDLLWRIKPSQAHRSTTCNEQEVFIFTPIFSFGIFPTFVWYLWIFSPIVRIRRAVKSPRLLAPLSLLGTLLLGSIHLNGLASWGSSFIYAFGWALLFDEADSRKSAVNPIPAT